MVFGSVVAVGAKRVMEEKKKKKIRRALLTGESCSPSSREG